MTPSDRNPDTPADAQGVSRRGFLKGAGVTAAAIGLGESAQAGIAAKTGIAEDVKMIGPGPAPISLKINKKSYQGKAEPYWTLLDMLRDKLDFTGAKRVCNRGACGACTVMIDGLAVKSCSLFAFDAVGKEITTVEGLAKGGKLSKIQQAFVECDALQCGFCTPGMVMACTAFIQDNPKPKDRAEIAAGISGNICRCGTYQNVFEAVELATGTGRGRK